MFRGGQAGKVRWPDWGTVKQVLVDEGTSDQRCVASGTLPAIHNFCLLNGVSFSNLARGKAREYLFSTCQFARSHRRKDLTREIVCIWEKPGRSFS